MKIINYFVIASALFWVLDSNAVAASHLAKSNEKVSVSHASVVKVQYQSFHINKASRAQWQKLKGIGHKIADRIVTYREKNGDFSNVAGLYQVKGLSKMTLQHLEKNNLVHFIL